MKKLDPRDPSTAIGRALASIPREILNRHRRDVHRDLKPENFEPEPVAVQAVQRTLFEMETRDE